MVQPISREQHPLILAEVARFYLFLLREHRAPAKSEQPKEQSKPVAVEDAITKTQKAALDHLLSLTNSQSAPVRGAAFTTLSQPEVFRALADFEMSFPTQRCLDLVASLPSVPGGAELEALPAYHSYLKAAVNLDLSSLGRRALTQGSRTADLPSTKALTPLPASLKKLFESSNKPVTRGALASSLVATFHITNDPLVYDLTDTTVSKKIILACWQTAKRVYREFLQEANFISEWQARLLAVPSWTTFMRHYLLLTVKGTRVEAQEHGKKEVEDGTDALQRLVKGVLADLKERLKEQQNPLFSSNIIFAFAGVGLASSQLLQSKAFAEPTWDFLNTLRASEAGSAEEKIAASLSLAHLLGGLGSTDVHRLRETLKVLQASATEKHDDDWLGWAAAAGVGIAVEAASLEMGRGEQEKWGHLMAAVEFLQKAALGPSPLVSPASLLGGYVGLARVIPVLVRDGNEQRRQKALQIQEEARKRLTTCLPSPPGKKTPALQVAQAQGVVLLLGYSTATLLAIRALQQGEVVSTLQELLERFEEHRQTPGTDPAILSALMTSLSVLIHASEEAGLAFPSSARYTSDTWNATLQELLVDFSLPSQVHSASVQGMADLAGATQVAGGLYSQTFSLSRPTPRLQARHKNSIDLIMSVLESPSSDPPLCKASAFAVSRLVTLQQQADGDSPSSATSEPQNYERLPPDSVLRAVYLLLSSDDMKKGAPLPEPAVACLLGSLTEGVNPLSPPEIGVVPLALRLPPVDWSSVFSQLTQPGLYSERLRLLLSHFLLQKAPFSVWIPPLAISWTPHSPTSLPLDLCGENARPQYRGGPLRLHSPLLPQAPSGQLCRFCPAPGLDQGVWPGAGLPASPLWPAERARTPANHLS